MAISSEAEHDPLTTTRCSRCGETHSRRVNPILARIVLVLAWTLILGFGALLAILVPVNLILIPCWLMVGSSLGPLVAELFDAKCVRCGQSRASYAASAPPRSSPEVSRRLPCPAHERAVERALIGEP